MSNVTPSSSTPTVSQVTDGGALSEADTSRLLAFTQELSSHDRDQLTHRLSERAAGGDHADLAGRLLAFDNAMRREAGKHSV